MKLPLHIESMDREERILALIKDVDENNYKYTIRNLTVKYHIMPDTILSLIEILNLEVVGHKSKNQRREIERFIEYNPTVTAEQVMQRTGYSAHLVYSVGRFVGTRFQTKYTIKKKEIL